MESHPAVHIIQQGNTVRICEVGRTEGKTFKMQSNQVGGVELVELQLELSLDPNIDAPPTS